VDVGWAAVFGVGMDEGNDGEESEEGREEVHFWGWDGLVWLLGGSVQMVKTCILS
jgi:hypothetical protein